MELKYYLFLALSPLSTMKSCFIKYFSKIAFAAPVKLLVNPKKENYSTNEVEVLQTGTGS